LLSIERISSRMTAQVRRLCYRIDVPADRVAALRDRIAAVTAASECLVERKREPVRRVDLKPWLSELRLVSPDDSRIATSLEMILWLLPSGTARPDEVLQLLDLGDLADAGIVVERAWLELQDEHEPQTT